MWLRASRKVGFRSWGEWSIALLYLLTLGGRKTRLWTFMKAPEGPLISLPGP